MLRPGVRRLFRLALRRSDVRDEQIDDELRLHLQLRAEQLERQGMAPEAAREEALRRFGDLRDARSSLRREASGGDRRARFGEWLDGMLHDVRYAALVLRRDRALTAVVVVMLALGIGANAAMFGIVDRLLLRGPAWVQEPERVVRLYQTMDVPGRGQMTTGTFGYATYAALRGKTRTLSGVAAWGSSFGTLGRGDRAERIEVGGATWDFFDVLGVRPVLGRTFTRAEDSPPRGERVAVLDHGLWQREFGGDASVLGRDITINGTGYTIVGVMPPGFTGAGLVRVDVWLPMSTRSAGIAPDWWSGWGAQWLDVVGRLAPGATVAQASAEVTALRRAAYTGDDAIERSATFSLRPMRYDEQGGEPTETRVARWLLGVALVVLLVVCANVANLMLARAISRRREIAVRLALGISRGRLVRLLLIESTLRSLLGGAAAVGVAWLAGRVIRETLLPDVAWPDSPVDGRILAFTAAAALLTGAVVGLTPVLQAGSARLTDALASGGRAGGGRRARLRTALTVAQATMSVVLLVGAGLFVRSLLHVRSLSHGMDPERVLATSVSWPGLTGLPDSVRAAERAARDVRLETALDQVAALPGVEAAALSIGTPLRSIFTIRMRVAGWDSIPRLAGGGPFVQAVTPGYFATLGTRIRHGRGFSDADREGAERVAIVNETMARVLWPGRTPLGECLYVGVPRDSTAPQPGCTRVVGIVENVRRSTLREEPAMQYYVPLAQSKALGIGGRQLLVRPRGDAALFTPTLRRALADALPGALYINVEPISSYMDPLVRPWRVGAMLFGLFGALALVVAALGLYSVMAYTVAQRTHELGVRRALGARATDLLRLVLVSGLTTVAAGCALGLLAALVGGRFLAALLFDTSPRDLAVFATVTASMLLAAAIASLVPARRAARVDPMVALRAD